MNRFLLGALAMGAIFVLTSFAVSTRSEPARAVPGGPAWTVSQYQLDRAFRVPVGPFGFSGQIPAGGGFIITQVRMSPPTTSNGNCSITVNGVVESIDLHYQGQSSVELNPPIICRPGDTVIITTGGGTVFLGGYTTLPGET